MSAISTRALGEFVQIRTGKLDANASSEDGEYPFFTCAKEPLRISTFSYDCDCVLVAGNGDLNVKHYRGKFDAYQRTYIVEPLNSSVLNTRFLFHFLDKYVEKLRHLSIGGVIKYIKIGNLTEAPLPVLPIDEQRRIAAILDQAESLRTQRRQALAHLDTLTQSLFFDMFGDPATSPKYSTGTIRRFVEANSGKSAKFVLSESPTDIPIYGGNGINGCATAALYEQPVLVFGRVGQQCGNAFLTQGPSWVTDNAIVVRIADTSQLIAKYVLHAFQGSEFSSRVKHLDLPFINQGMILDNPIPLPPLPLQQTFATRIQAIEALKATHRAALDQLDALFASLQQRAFAGEL
ncbi:MAG: restriction endonuclease subunit S [Burkholderiales bacterium]|nr:restriction endonuclease subunit S [Burkholderiales bacterium]